MMPRWIVWAWVWAMVSTASAGDKDLFLQDDVTVWGNQAFTTTVVTGSSLASVGRSREAVAHVLWAPNTSFHQTLTLTPTFVMRDGNVSGMSSSTWAVPAQGGSVLTLTNNSDQDYVVWDIPLPAGVGQVGFVGVLNTGTAAVTVTVGVQ